MGVYLHEIFVKFSRRYEIPSRECVIYSKNHTYPVEIDFTKTHMLAIFELHRNALPTQSGWEVLKTYPEGKIFPLAALPRGEKFVPVG